MPSIKTNVHRMLCLLLFTWGAVLFQGCAHQFVLPDETHLTVYKMAPSADAQMRRWAPVFLTYGYGDDYNRIGRPTAGLGQEDREDIWIDTDQPMVYVMQRSFTTPKETYTNLIYRIHFPDVPYSLVPFNLTAGDNVGILVIVTLNRENQPVLVTSVGTCGCYKAFVPTDFLPNDALPEDWPVGEAQTVYGERLPARLSYGPIAQPTLIVHLRPGVHRVMDLEVVPADQLESTRYHKIAMSSAPMTALLDLHLDGGTTTSFYYEEGWRKGYVKGSVKPFEMLFMSLISLDLFVGSDKIYADPEVWGNHFYTSLKPWRRNDSDMWDFARFLRYWGWRL